jgi:hypothetical protein
MWKFIITWCVLNEIMLPNQRTTDEYGRTSMSTTLEYRYEIKADCNHSKDFFSRKDAFKFYREAYKQQADTIRFDSTYYVIERGWDLRNVKIDSVFIKAD